MTTVNKTKGLEALSRFGALLKQHGLQVDNLADLNNPHTCVRQADVEQMLNEGAELEASLNPKAVKTSKVSMDEFKKTLTQSIGSEEFTFETVTVADIAVIVEKAGQEMKNDVIIPSTTFSPDSLSEKISASRTDKEPVSQVGKKVRMNK